MVRPGAGLEVRGPLGGFFAWDGRRAVLGAAGGSGVVPLMSMLRPTRALGRPELGRIAADDLVPALDGGRTVYVCGTPPSCDRATELLIGLGVPTARIRVERFGPSG